MKHAGPTRRELGIRTAFNLLGPLTNPAGATRQVVGVPRSELTELLARALLMLGSTRAWVVHGADGIDEISTTGYTKVSECRDGSVRTFYVHPSDFGMPKDNPGGPEGWRRRPQRSDRDRRPCRFPRGAAPRGRAQRRSGTLCRRSRDVGGGRHSGGRFEAIDSGAARQTLDRMVRGSQEVVVA
jgi:anthranilate phosphoribosyltransferase